VISLAGFTRRRKALVAAVLPYMLLSLFVDFVHLHRLIAGPIPAASASAHIKADQAGSTKLPESSCAICQWMRAGTGMQAAVAAEQAPADITTTLVARSILAPVRLDLGSPDFRGPPASLSL
jgi:hypothetical protein